MEPFNDTIEDLCSIDLPMARVSYTHSNFHENASLPRIDRALVSSNWDDLYRAKLKNLKMDLAEWNKVPFRRTEVVIKETLDKIFVIDSLEERQQISFANKVERCLLMCDFDKLWKREEISWRQKARDRWTRDGDRNTTFFTR
ncbi:hypothetical protein LINPERHAP2_LOCUS39211 [Linum perenne]